MTDLSFSAAFGRPVEEPFAAGEPSVFASDDGVGKWPETSPAMASGETADDANVSVDEATAAKDGDAPGIAPDAEALARHPAIHEAMRARAEAVLKLRRNGPAESVADDPNVRVAAEEFDPQRPETAKALINARLAAQERAGIANPSVLTSTEERDLLRPLAQAARDAAAGKDSTPEIAEQAQDQFRHRIEETYGAHAETVMRGLAERLTATITETASADGSQATEQDDGFDRSLISSVKFMPGVGIGAQAATGATAAASAKAAQALMLAIKDIPDAPRRTAAYTAATFQILNWYLRRQVLNQQTDDPDKPSETPKPLDAGSTVEREAVTSNSASSHHDPEDPEEKSLIEKALTAAKIAEAAKSIGRELPKLPDGARVIDDLLP